MSYRAYVQPWVGKPLYPPKGAAVSSNHHTTVYASWNGATQVSRWKVVTADGHKVVATSPRKGFETAIQIGSGATSYEVQALDRNGHVLDTSKPFAVRS